MIPHLGSRFCISCEGNRKVNQIIGLLSHKGSKMIYWGRWSHWSGWKHYWWNRHWPIGEATIYLFHYFQDTSIRWTKVIVSLWSLRPLPRSFHCLGLENMMRNGMRCPWEDLDNNCISNKGNSYLRIKFHYAMYLGVSTNFPSSSTFYVFNCFKEYCFFNFVLYRPVLVAGKLI